MRRISVPGPYSLSSARSAQASPAYFMFIKMEAKHSTNKELQNGPQMDFKWEPKWSKVGSRRNFRKWSKIRSHFGRANGAILVTVLSFWQGEASKKRFTFATILGGLWDPKWA